MWQVFSRASDDVKLLVNRGTIKLTLVGRFFCAPSAVSRLRVNSGDFTRITGSTEGS